MSGNKLTRVSVLTLAVLITLGCAANSPNSPNAGAGNTLRGDEFVVELKSNKISPATIKVKKGQPIHFKNTDGEKHNVYSPENRFKGIDIPSGKSAILALDATGSYPFVCEYHPNLTGVIMVE